MRTGKRHPKFRFWSILARLTAGVLILTFMVSCSGVSPRDLTVPETAAPLITFVFDDGYDTDYLIGRELFALHGAVACSAITTDWISTPRYLSPGQIRGLRDAGWEIMAHSATHPNLRSLDPAQLDVELSRSKDALEGLGITVRNLVYPYNKSNDQVRRIARKYYRSGRGGTNQLNRTVPDPYDLRSFTTRQNIANLKRAIDRADRERAWVIIYHHEIDAKITISNKKGMFQKGEQLVFSPSGAVGRHVRDNWFLTAGSVHFAPLAGTPRAGDRIIGSASNAEARLEHVAFNEREMIDDLLRYVRTNHPAMRIVTIDQGLDLLGVSR